jgi:hypothetical protein
MKEDMKEDVLTIAYRALRREYRSPAKKIAETGMSARDACIVLLSDAILKGRPKRSQMAKEKVQDSAQLVNHVYD